MWENLGQKSFPSPTKPLEEDIWLHLDCFPFSFFFFFLSVGSEGGWGGWKCWEEIERALYSGLSTEMKEEAMGCWRKEKNKTWELPANQRVRRPTACTPGRQRSALSGQRTLQSQRPRSHPKPFHKKSTKRNKHSPKKSWRCSENSAALNSEGTPAGGRWTGGQAVISWSDWGQIGEGLRRERERNMWCDSGEHFRTECSPAHRGNFCFLWGHQKKNHFQNVSFFFFFSKRLNKKNVSNLFTQFIPNEESRTRNASWRLHIRLMQEGIVCWLFFGNFILVGVAVRLLSHVSL